MSKTVIRKGTFETNSSSVHSMRDTIILFVILLKAI